MLKKEDLPDFIDNEVIKRVNDWMQRSLVTHDDNGNPDFKAMIHNASYNIGDIQIEASGLLLQEEGKLADMEEAYDTARAEQLEQLMNKQIGFEKTPERVKILLDGSTDANPKKNLSKMKLNIKKQKAYIEHLKRYCDQVKFYPNGVRVILDTFAMGRDAGKI